MKPSGLLLSCAVWILALLMMNPSLQAAKKKHVAAKKEHPERVIQQKGEDAQEKIEKEISNLRTDVYSRATWEALQKVKQEADDTAGSIKLVTFIGGGIGFLIGCVVTGLVAKRMGRSDDALKIT